jgi:XTP/dITP diphosphohydrolase
VTSQPGSEPSESRLPGSTLLDVVQVMDRLRSPGGCPWDAEQTHESLAGYLLEEAYETLEAIEDGDSDGLREELGDVLLQVVFHARIAAEQDPGWTIDDLAQGLVDKLVRRHPHVFGSTSADTPAEVEANWDEIKKAEKGRTSVTEGVPLGQPALSLAAKLQSRAARIGQPASLVVPALSAAESPAAAVCAAAVEAQEAAPDEVVQHVGDLLFAAVALARELDVDPEAALRASARRFRDQLVEEGL